MSETRATWDEYFLRIAREVSTRATCSRRSVGCVLVRDKKILATGYNGSIRGLAHCTDVGCLMEEGHCVRTVHAEANAIIQAAQSLEGATAYVTSLPCWSCFRMLAQARITRIVFDDMYPNPWIVGTAAQAGIQLVQFATAEGPPL
jgi:dCMP deaminase